MEYSNAMHQIYALLVCKRNIYMTAMSLDKDGFEYPPNEEIERRGRKAEDIEGKVSKILGVE